MRLTKRSVRSRDRALLMACLIGVVASSAAGCGESASSPANVSKGQEAVRKKFDDSGDKALPKK